VATFKRIENKIFTGLQPTEQDLQAPQQQGIRTAMEFRLPSGTSTSNQTLTTNHGMV